MLNHHWMTVKQPICSFPSVWKILNRFVSIWSAQCSPMLLCIKKVFEDIKLSWWQFFQTSEACLSGLFAVILSSLRKPLWTLDPGRPAGGSTDLARSPVRRTFNSKETRKKQEAHWKQSNLLHHNTWILKKQTNKTGGDRSVKGNEWEKRFNCVYVSVCVCV